MDQFNYGGPDGNGMDLERFYLDPECIRSRDVSRYDLDSCTVLLDDLLRQELSAVVELGLGLDDDDSAAGRREPKILLHGKNKNKNGSLHIFGFNLISPVQLQVHEATIQCSAALQCLTTENMPDAGGNPATIYSFTLPPNTGL